MVSVTARKIRDHSVERTSAGLGRIYTGYLISYPIVGRGMVIFRDPHGHRMITTPVKRNSAVGFIQETYPALANCPRCPADATQPGTLLRDWTTSTWTLDDGSRVYPPGFDPNAPDAGSE